MHHNIAGGGRDGSSWLEYRLLSGARPVEVAVYDVVSANDCPERDPADWVLEGAADAGEDVGGREMSVGGLSRPADAAEDAGEDVERCVFLLHQFSPQA